MRYQLRRQWLAFIQNIRKSQVWLQLTIIANTKGWEKNAFRRISGRQNWRFERIYLACLESLNRRRTAGASVLLSTLFLFGLMLREWARGILTVTSSVDNPQQLLPWGRVCAPTLLCASMNQSTTAKSAATLTSEACRRITSPRQPAGNRKWGAGFSAATHRRSSCPFRRSQLPVCVFPFYCSSV